MLNLLYNENNLIGRLYRYFYIYFTLKKYGQTCKYKKIVLFVVIMGLGQYHTALLCIVLEGCGVVGLSCPRRQGGVYDYRTKRVYF